MKYSVLTKQNPRYKYHKQIAQKTRSSAAATSLSVSIIASIYGQLSLIYVFFPHLPLCSLALHNLTCRWPSSLFGPEMALDEGQKMVVFNSQNVFFFSNPQNVSNSQNVSHSEFMIYKVRRIYNHLHQQLVYKNSKIFATIQRC